jgi:hypothetical protein
MIGVMQDNDAEDRMTMSVDYPYPMIPPNDNDALAPNVKKARLRGPFR